MMEYMIALYLRSKGWQCFEEFSGASVWLSPDGDELAITSDVISTLRELAALEGRRAEQLFGEIRGATWGSGGSRLAA